MPPHLACAPSSRPLIAPATRATPQPSTDSPPTPSNCLRPLTPRRASCPSSNIALRDLPGSSTAGRSGPAAVLAGLDAGRHRADRVLERCLVGGHISASDGALYSSFAEPTAASVASSSVRPLLPSATVDPIKNSTHASRPES